jgi:hypothetical protein
LNGSTGKNPRKPDQTDAKRQRAQAKGAPRTHGQFGQLA